MTTFSTNSSLPISRLTMPKACANAEPQNSPIAYVFAQVFAVLRRNPDEVLPKSARREAARRSVDNLLR